MSIPTRIPSSVTGNTTASPGVDRIARYGAFAWVRPSLIWMNGRPLPVMGLLLAISFVLYAWNVGRAPDFFVDETAYVQAGRNIANGDSVAFGQDPIMVHPPLYFLSVAGWLALFGHLDTTVVDGIAAARHLDVLYDLLLIVLIGVLARNWSASWSPARRGALLVGAMVLTALNPFLLRFGRAVLIEPMAVGAGLLALLVAWRLRHAPSVLYVTIVGAFIGLAILIKAPVLFVVGAPLVAAMLQRDGRLFLRHLSATAVGGLVWSAFPLWAYLTGNWRHFSFVQGVSLRRLLGIVQLTGLNRPGVSPLDAVKDTLLQYSGAYVAFVAGALVLALGLWQARRRSLLLDDGAAQILALGITSYSFLAYSVAFGQSNEQLTVYTVPAAALLVAGAPAIVRRPYLVVREVVAAVALVAVALCAVSWLLFLAGIRDDATARVAAFVSANLPACAPVNATGDVSRWQSIVRTHPITEYRSGPEALAKGVHIFLDSPKDATFAYGPSNAELSAWLAENGRRVLSLSSHTSRRISVFVVGEPVTPPGKSLPGCVPPLADPQNLAPATTFAATLTATLGADLLVALAAWLVIRRKSRSRGPAIASSGKHAADEDQPTIADRSPPSGV